MDDGVLLPGYIPRPREQRSIRQEAARVSDDRRTRAVLLYGPGGVGKTLLVRELARTASDDTTIWLQPIDVDDSEYWLLSNLERKVAEELDPSRQYFGPYLDYLARIPRFMRQAIGHETILSHLGRMTTVFRECYGQLVHDGGKTVVIALDTVEAVRGMYLLVTLTQWMKALPATLFIVSGRPPSAGVDPQDPIASQLEEGHQRLPVKSIRLAEFSQTAALKYLDTSLVAAALSTAEKKKLIYLTRGHPLWLALATDYLAHEGLPEEAERHTLTQIRQDLPYKGEMTRDGQSLHEAFKRQLVTPYIGTDFWHEAIKRLAVVRQSVKQPIWEELMHDRSLPEGTDTWEDAWNQLLQTAWVRPRANRRYVTLHDAVAEELAQRIIPLHDQDKAWRRGLWERAVGIYTTLTVGPEEALDRQLAELDRRLLAAVRRDPRSEAEERELMQTVAELDVEKRELDQLKTARLYYQILCDFETGCQQFLALFEQASRKHDILFRELISLEMQRFLPNGIHLDALGDVIRAVIDDFHTWLSSTSPGSYIDIGLDIARYLIENGQPRPAIDLLDRLPVAEADPDQRYQLSNQLGNAWMRIPQHARVGERHFRQALEWARELTPPKRERLEAQGLKELGFYFRNEGLWPEADDAYRQARDAISATLSPQSAAEDREEIASIQTNWAYVKALRGNYHEAQNLVESAVTVRRRLGNDQGVGQSLSVYGELFRYARNFEKAWEHYEEAEGIFRGLRNSPWLGTIYQEQAICLFQAAQEEIDLVKDPLDEAERRIGLALDICRDLAVLEYPSALNRAGRIFGQRDFRTGLRYLEEGIEAAGRLASGWFLFANMIEYLELSYRAWQETGDRAYRDLMNHRMQDIGPVRASASEKFPDLEGRWHLLQGHVIIHDALETGARDRLNEALGHYRDGFALIARGYVGSHGASAIPSEFKRFGLHFKELPDDVREHWLREFRRAWTNPKQVQLESSATLLARLEELY